MKKLSIVPIIAVLVFLIGCNKTEAQANQSSSPVAQSTVDQSNSSQPTVQGQPTLMFFMNPGGRPCIIQDSIITEMGDSLTNKATVFYVRTTEMTIARPLFQKYGVRGIPAIIVLNADGSVKERLQPGVKGASAIYDAIN